VKTVWACPESRPPVNENDNGGKMNLNPASVFEILGRLSTAKSYADIQPVIADLMEKVGAMSRDNQLLSEENTKLKKDVARFQDFRATAKKYRTNNEDTGVVTRVLKEPTDEQEKAHRFCANCFQNSKIRYLQPLKDTELMTERHGWFRVHNCRECGDTLTFGFVQAYNTPQVRHSRPDHY
jgi:regulator of replication initiation timing